MTTPGSNIFSRYQQARTTIFLDNDRNMAHWFPSLRARTRRRKFVIFLLIVLTASAVLALADPILDGAIGAWAICYIVFTFAAILLGIVSPREAEAPADALDELEIQKRNEARSIGLTVTRTLGTAAAAYLLLGSAFGTTNLGISGAALMLTALSAGGSTPAMLLAWSSPDPDPEDG